MDTSTAAAAAAAAAISLQSRALKEPAAEPHNNNACSHTQVQLTIHSYLLVIICCTAHLQQAVTASWFLKSCIAPVRRRQQRTAWSAGDARTPLQDPPRRSISHSLNLSPQGSAQPAFVPYMSPDRNRPAPVSVILDAWVLKAEAMQLALPYCGICCNQKGC